MNAVRRILSVVAVLLLVTGGAEAQVVTYDPGDPTGWDRLGQMATFAQTSVYGQSTVWGAPYHINGSLLSAGSFVKVRDELNGVVLLGAGHVVANMNNPNFAMFKATDRSNIYTNTNPILTATAWGVHPGYTGVSGVGVDLGYLVFPAGSFANLPTATLSQTALAAGEHVFLGGYGAPGVYQQGMYPYDGVERIGENTIGFTTLEGYANVSFLSGPALSLEAITSGGTSGGGYFRNDGTLAAIAAYGALDNSSSYGLDLAPHYGYVMSIPVPEPTSTLLVGLPFVVILARKGLRKRSKSV